MGTPAIISQATGGQKMIRRHRFHRLAAVCVTALASLAGCTTYNEPLAAFLDDIKTPPVVAMDGLHVRMRRPQLVDPPLPEFRWWSAEDLLALRKFEAERAVAALRAAKLFASVEFDDIAAPGPVVRLDARHPIEIGNCASNDILVPYITLGLLPAICTRNTGIAFAFPDRKLPVFQCPWPQTKVTGGILFSLGLTPRGKWSEEPDQQAFLQNLRHCIAEQSDAFQLATDARQP